MSPPTPCSKPWKSLRVMSGLCWLPAPRTNCCPRCAAAACGMPWRGPTRCGHQLAARAGRARSAGGGAAARGGWPTAGCPAVFSGGARGQPVAVLPGAVGRGEVAVFKDWAPLQVVDALHKLCADLAGRRCAARAPAILSRRNCPRRVRCAPRPVGHGRRPRPGAPRSTPTTPG